MTYYLVKLIITALVVVVVSEVAKKSTFIGAIIISIPLTSLLAFIWLYVDTKDYQKVIDLSYGTILLSIPSFAFFIILPLLLKFKYNFIISITTENIKDGSITVKMKENKMNDTILSKDELFQLMDKLYE